MALRLPRRRLAGLGLLVALAVATVATDTGSAVALVERTLADPTWFALSLVVLYLVRPMLAIPTMAAAAVVGYGYGVWVGIPVALAGTTLSSIPPYLAGRYFRCTDGLLGRLCARGESFFQRTGDTRGVIAARLAPTPSDPTSYAAGLSQVRLRPFLAGTAVGEIHWTALAVVAGASVRELSGGVVPSVTPGIVLLTTLAALAVLAAPAYRAVVERRGGGAGG